MQQFFTYSSALFGALVGFALAVNISIYTQTSHYIYDDVGAVPEARVVIIPGAAVYQNGTLSPIFTARVDLAIALYEAKKVSKILVSGDNSTVSHNEVNPVRLYLIGKGIPDQDIFLDHAGFDTYSTMYRARSVFGVSSVIVATQSFHLPRAVFIARSLGLVTYGVRADRTHSVVPTISSNNVREFFANEKAVFDLAFAREPKYLGDTIPILGDGRNYP